MSFDESIPTLLGGPPVRPDGPPTWPCADADIVAAVEQCIRSGAWGRYQGEVTARFRERVAEFFAAEHVHLVSSGTVAIELALRGLNIGAGDEVILAGYDFRGNFLNVLTVGATPVLVDLDPRTGQLDPQRAAAAITSRTRAVIASHLHGGVVDLDALRAVLDDRNIAIIEDACQMPGAPLGAVRAGMGGDVGVISFGGSKLLSAGRGGAILTNRADISARIRRYGFRGNDAYPLSELQASVLLPQLEKLDVRRADRRMRVAELSTRLADLGGLTRLGEASCPAEPDFYKVGLRYDAGQFDDLPREVFAAAMQAEGIAIFPGFRALHCLHARSRFRQADSLEEAARADSEWLVLHHPVLLEGALAIQEIVDAVGKIRRHADRLQETEGLVAGGVAGLWESDS